MDLEARGDAGKKKREQRDRDKCVVHEIEREYSMAPLLCGEKRTISSVVTEPTLGIAQL